MNRKDKIQALAALAKGDIAPHKKVISQSMQTVFIEMIDDNSGAVVTPFQSEPVSNENVLAILCKNEKAIAAAATNQFSFIEI